jgi:hypothetical protein
MSIKSWCRFSIFLDYDLHLNTTCILHKTRSVNIYTHETQYIVRIMSDSDPKFIDYCKTFMDEYDGWFVEKYKMQVAYKKKPMVHITHSGKKVSLMCQWYPPEGTTLDSIEFDGLDEDLKIALRKATTLYSDS